MTRRNIASGDMKTGEVRSEKVRRLLGGIPRGGYVWGYIIIALFAALLVVAALLIEYPYGHGESIMRHILSDIL